MCLAGSHVDKLMQARIYRLLQCVALLGIATHGASVQNRSYSYSRVTKHRIRPRIRLNFCCLGSGRCQAKVCNGSNAALLARTTTQNTNFPHDRTRLKPAGRTRVCKVLGPDRTKMFHVKHFVRFRLRIGHFCARRRLRGTACSAYNYN
jgi:hypothetical protein